GNERDGHVGLPRDAAHGASDHLPRRLLWTTRGVRADMDTIVPGAAGVSAPNSGERDRRGTRPLPVANARGPGLPAAGAAAGVLDIGRYAHAGEHRQASFDRRVRAEPHEPHGDFEYDR